MLLLPARAPLPLAALARRIFAVLGVLALVVGCGGNGASAPDRAAPAGLTEAGPVSSVPVVAALVGDAAVKRKRAFSAGRMPDAESFMNWAEAAVPQFFPGRKTTVSATGLVYRYYPETQSYLGVLGSTVAVLGPATQGVVLTVGSLADFACQVYPTDCAGTTLTPRGRPFAARSAQAVVGEDGSVLVFGGAAIGAGLTSPVAGSSAQRVIGTRDVVSLAGWTAGDGLALTGQGEALAWGARHTSYGGDPGLRHVPIVPASRVNTVSRTVQTADVSDPLVQLHDDGTVWFAVNWNGTVRVEPVAGISDVVALNTGLADAAGVLAIKRDGSVWRLRPKPVGYGYEVDRQIVELSDVVQVDCMGRCVALTRQGRIYTWLDVSIAHQDVEPVADIHDVVAVAIGGLTGDPSRAAGLAVTRSGGLWGWGIGARGGWGRAPVTFGPVPVRIADDAVGVSCAGESPEGTGLVVLKDGTVWRWGEMVRAGGFQSVKNMSYTQVEGLRARTCEPHR